MSIAKVVIATPRILHGTPLMLEANPEPPGDFTTSEYNIKRIVFGALLSGSIALAGLGLSMGTAQAFNPQPDPPGKVAIQQKV